MNSNRYIRFFACVFLYFCWPIDTNQRHWHFTAFQWPLLDLKFPLAFLRTIFVHSSFSNQTVVCLNCEISRPTMMSARYQPLLNSLMTAALPRWPQFRRMTKMNEFNAVTAISVRLTLVKWANKEVESCSEESTERCWWTGSNWHDKAVACQYDEQQMMMTMSWMHDDVEQQHNNSRPYQWERSGTEGTFITSPAWLLSSAIKVMKVVVIWVVRRWMWASCYRRHWRLAPVIFLLFIYLLFEV